MMFQCDGSSLTMLEKKRRTRGKEDDDRYSWWFLPNFISLLIALLCIEREGEDERNDTILFTCFRSRIC